ncbi:MAG TPA: STN and carboxypeptidase regulatory-like domain-containing protein, partial [Ohtaekwangia sp.]|nr:STN and carboxypeptidase regulatory-like domain-containing protein [Ohtaekwangia sp.]
MKKCFATKLLLVMRICVVQGLIVLLISMSCLAHTGFAQLLDKPVTVHLSDVPFVDALKEIGESANIRFVYSADQLTSESNVSLTAKQMPLRQLLEELLDPREITYKVHEREASITLRKRVSETPVRESHDRQGNLHRKVQQITGQVTDGSTTLPMPGVNILVKGTLTGTTT